jgi:hypothetical protein
MKVAIISNESGKILAALKLADDRVRVGMRSRDKSHQYHEIDLPEKLASARIKDIVKELKIDKTGGVPHFR